MAGEEDPDALWDAVRGTIEGYAPQVRDWMEERPGAWGFLAGKAVIAYRQGLGRGACRSWNAGGCGTCCGGPCRR